MGSSARTRTVRILGTHGVPAAYGGFETAAQQVGTYLADRGWRVVVYCQEQGTGPIRTDTWQGIERVLVPVPRDDWLGTSHFDLRSTLHAARTRDLALVFGYNTAILNVLQRVARCPVVFNMDGLEWSRARWGKIRQGILYSNQQIACWTGQALIADHPAIEEYLRRHAPERKLSMITYGAHRVDDAPAEILDDFGLTPGGYLTVICRPIPENSVLEVVTGFSARPRGVKLAVLGAYEPEVDTYHRAVRAAAGDEVVFLGAVYDPDAVAALRFHSRGYLHGHTVGGTNPSLVEAMAAGNPVVAHDNTYNRWTAGDAALYFTSATEVDDAVTTLLDDDRLADTLAANSRRRHAEEFTWEHVAGQYEKLLSTFT